MITTFFNIVVLLNYKNHFTYIFRNTSNIIQNTNYFYIISSQKYTFNLKSTSEKIRLHMSSLLFFSSNRSKVLLETVWIILIFLENIKKSIWSSPTRFMVERMRMKIFRSLEVWHHWSFFFWIIISEGSMLIFPYYT